MARIRAAWTLAFALLLASGLPRLSAGIRLTGSGAEDQAGSTFDHFSTGNPAATSAAADVQTPPAIIQDALAGTPPLGNPASKRLLQASPEEADPQLAPAQAPVTAEDQDVDFEPQKSKRSKQRSCK